MAINSSTAESTGYSPSYLTQGREPRLPKPLYDEVTPGTGVPAKSPEERVSMLHEIFHIVRRNMQVASQEQRRHYNLRRRPASIKIGDKVLVRHHSLSKAIDNYAAKLAPRYIGPYEVIAKPSQVILRLQGTNPKDIRTAHVSEVKLYNPAEPDSEFENDNSE